MKHKCFLASPERDIFFYEIGYLEIFGIWRPNSFDFLSKIDELEVQILKIFSPAAGFVWNIDFWCPKPKILSQIA